MSQRPEKEFRRIASSELGWDIIIIGATELPLLASVLPQGNALRGLAVLSYLMIVPGMAVITWVRDARSEVWAPENLMLVVPLGFSISVIGSLTLIYSGFWSPTALVVAISIGSLASAWIHTIRHPYKHLRDANHDTNKQQPAGEL